MNNLTTSNIDPKHAGHTPVPEAIGSPLFSIVLPTHNRPALLEEAVASVCQQDLPGWELLIIDDASDPPVEARNFSASAGRIRVCRNAEAQGGAASKALGTQLATGQFVAYLDDDDLFAPEFLSTAASVFSELPDLDVLFVGVEWFGKNADKEGRPHSESLDWVIANTETRPFKTDALLLGENLFDSLLQKVPMPFQRPVVRQSSLKQIGLHTPHCLLWDCDWALRAALHARCALTTKPLYRQRASQQGYYSRSGTSVAQATSELEIARRLYRESKTAVHDSGKTRPLRRSIGKRAHQLAYINAKKGHPLQTLYPWILGQRFRPGWRVLRTPLSAFYYAARALHRRVASKVSH